MNTGEIRYVVVTGSGEEDPCFFHELDAPHLCSSKEEAETLIEAVAGQEGRDWAVYEVVDGRCSARSVIFKDGAAEIQARGA